MRGQIFISFSITLGWRKFYCFASGAASTALQATGSDAIVIGGFGFGGVGGGFGWRTESLNQ
jgi:hypothetical protein